ncbi:hypothetical protein CFC21_037766 [Triticum aestivum]|uniref:Uncharacterized protein n=2 Tax=Triticum aestivum TaxID=4565 RepID=A0A9R1JQF6_WHEAT|nr:hypothetical protein CFC21_037766 [Triticum aestivum]
MPTGTMRRMFVESSSSSSSSGSGRQAEATVVLCAPRPRRVHAQPCSADLILGPPPFLLDASSGSNSRKQREGKSKTREVHDPHFLLNQRHHAAADFNLAAVFDHHLHHHSRTHHHHVPTYSNSSSNHSFAPSYTHAAPAVRIQGFDVAACRGSHGSNGGGRVLSARA